MPTQNSGLYKVILKTTFVDQDLINIWNFRSVTGTEDLQTQVATAFNNYYLTALQALLSATVTFDTLTVDNLTGGNAPHIHVYPAGTTGQAVGDAMPPFNAATFILNRFFKDTRNGSKRIGPSVEGFQTGGEWEPAYKSLLQDLADIMAAPIVDGGNTFTHIILGKLVSPGTWMINNIASVDFKDFVRSQVSRRR